MDTTHIRELLAKRDDLDAEIREAVGGEVKERKTITCSNCGEAAHTARTCTKPKTLSLPKKGENAQQ